ncbi:hypothetical protein [Corynebacterium pygosceleis]|uniref:Uncharacterized protein n=1 Tax=Corynebacterium pygosceleis TaxID=2800406 RepID=A0A9Q4GKM7_9CORY|nr:hypothetical protein [Corynebacterium pygosceleis]MCK7638228.1 hypothetical protein [Corynebacterium pygosceleis]MCL0121590.1 hypothetical protein [Corynebacterium pygosceleis]MCX7445787.1 hypothetical protein [Corynebacterium pygosceleis]MCX7469384.1 hypothetical protein [Corynebacterium pygosceleis]
MKKFRSVPVVIAGAAFVFSVIVFAAAKFGGVELGLSVSLFSFGILLSITYWRIRLVSAKQLNLVRSLNQEFTHTASKINKLCLLVEQNASNQTAITEMRTISRSVNKQRDLLVQVQAQLDTL